MSAIVERVLGLHGLAVYLTVGLLVFAEDAVFVGLVVPGESAAILGGAAASRGNASVVALCVIVVVAAILGDNLGYLLGRLYGPRLLATNFMRRRAVRVERARRYLERRGGPAVLAGRYIAFLRAVTPFLAGTARLKYSRFLAYDVVAGVTWGVASVLVGYLAGNSYRAIERAVGPVTAAVAAVVVIAAVAVWIVRRSRSERRKDDSDLSRDASTSHEPDLSLDVDLSRDVDVPGDAASHPDLTSEPDGPRLAGEPHDSESVDAGWSSATGEPRAQDASRQTERPGRRC